MSGIACHHCHTAPCSCEPGRCWKCGARKPTNFAVGDGCERCGVTGKPPAPPATAAESLGPWQLVNEVLGSGYGWYDPLPWPPAPPQLGGWLLHGGMPVLAYLQALGERQRKFEQESNRETEKLVARVRELERRCLQIVAFEQAVVNLELNTQSLFKKMRELGERTIGMAKF